MSRGRSFGFDASQCVRCHQLAEQFSQHYNGDRGLDVPSPIRRHTGDFGMRTLIQLLHGPDLYGVVSRFERMRPPAGEPSGNAACLEPGAAESWRARLGCTRNVRSYCSFVSDVPRRISRRSLRPFRRAVRRDLRRFTRPVRRS